MKKIFSLRFGTETYWKVLDALENLKNTYAEDIEIYFFRNGQNVNIVINVKNEKKVILEDIEAIKNML